MKKGDIVLIPFPFTDLSGSKNRPALILVETVTDITVAFITTQTKWEEKYDLRIEPTKDNGLKKPSLVRLSKITTLDRELILGRLGILSIAELTKLNQNLMGLLKLN